MSVSREEFEKLAAKVRQQEELLLELGQMMKQSSRDVSKMLQYLVRKAQERDQAEERQVKGVNEKEPTKEMRAPMKPAREHWVEKNEASSTNMAAKRPRLVLYLGRELVEWCRMDALAEVVAKHFGFCRPLQVHVRGAHLIMTFLEKPDAEGAANAILGKAFVEARKGERISGLPSHDCSSKRDRSVRDEVMRYLLHWLKVHAPDLPAHVGIANVLETVMKRCPGGKKVLGSFMGILENAAFHGKGKEKKAVEEAPKAAQGSVAAAAAVAVVAGLKGSRPAEVDEEGKCDSSTPSDAMIQKTEDCTCDQIEDKESKDEVELHQERSSDATSKDHRKIPDGVEVPAKSSAEMRNLKTDWNMKCNSGEGAAVALADKCDSRCDGWNARKQPEMQTMTLAKDMKLWLSVGSAAPRILTPCSGHINTVVTICRWRDQRGKTKRPA